MNKIITLLLAVSLSTVAQAADLSKTDKVEKLFVLMETDKMMDTMYSQIEGMVVGMGQQLGIKEGEQEIFDAYMADVMKIMKEDMSWQKMKKPLVDVYTKHYSEEELEGMLAFFSSDVGKSMTEKMPAVMQDSMVISQSMMQSILPKIQQAAQNMEKELAAAREASADH